MLKDWKINYYKPDRPGIFFKENSICFAADTNGNTDFGIMIYSKDDMCRKIPFISAGRNGTLAGVEVFAEEDIQYHYYRDDKVFTDPYATGIKGLEVWGGAKNAPRETVGYITRDTFDWQGDVNPLIPYEDSIIYGLNVRAFTMHKSAAVKYNGTFEGVAEKIPYLKNLGITAVELMPCYEYEECLFQEGKRPEYRKIDQEEKHLEEKMRLNCWGFQKGYYFAPKASYSAINSPSISFKKMVREFHKNGMEVFMHFYFPPEIRALFILDVLKYWVSEYHVDGFRISGMAIPHRILKEDPLLKYTKLRFDHLPDEINKNNDDPMRNLSVGNQGFFVDMRKYLKGDEGLINQIIAQHRNNPKEYACINYLTDYNNFSLFDMVAYETKHNENNGEDNRDGTDLNYSWNCGIEGETRKKAVLSLRIRQMKNALSLLLLSQGTPYIFSGDERANTRYGNNNPYCQDNEIGWIKWKESKLSKEILDYTAFLIKLRKENRILHMPEELKIMDGIGCGMPDISYHGVEAWRPDMGYMSRMIGIMLWGPYAGSKDSFYICFNMHWEEHEMALPKLPKGMCWVKISDTTEGQMQEAEVSDQNFAVKTEARSVVIYRTKEVPVANKIKGTKSLGSKIKEIDQ